MNRFAELLDRLAYEPGRNNKLRLITNYFRDVEDPDRGYALAALTGALSFKHAKPGLIRDLIAERTDPCLVRAVLRLCRRPLGDGGADVAENVRQIASTTTRRRRPSPKSSPRCARSARPKCRSSLSRWLDDLDETGRWALLKLVTGAMRIGISARLAKTAAAALGDKDAHEIELIWPGLTPPYLDLFAWLEGRGEKPVNLDPAPFRPVMLAHAIEDTDFANLDRCRLHRRMEVGRHSRAGRERPRRARPHRDPALFAQRRGHHRKLSRSAAFAASAGRDRRRTVGGARRPRAEFQRAATAPQPQSRSRQS